MKKIRKIFIIVIIIINISFISFAHKGRTDSSGGHYDRSTGEYHYHHGYPAHQHINGVCPYNSESETVNLPNVENTEIDTNNIVNENTPPFQGLAQSLYVKYSDTHNNINTNDNINSTNTINIIDNTQNNVETKDTLLSIIGCIILIVFFISPLLNAIYHVFLNIIEKYKGKNK